MVYQFNPHMLPDTAFVPGELKYLVPGNEGRWLDPRRTPVRVIDVKLASGMFVVELLAFEDKGGQWELPLERVDRCQFAPGSIEARDADVVRYREIIERLDRPLGILADASCRAASEATIATLRQRVGTWLDTESAFMRSGASPDFSGQTEHSALWSDLDRYMTKEGLSDIEDAFAEQYVRNASSGELIKGHSIVLAELGLVSFEGTAVRDPDLFGGSWSRERRAAHILHRLAFMRALFNRLRHSSVVVYRGMSYQGLPQPRARGSFVSATFSEEIARSHFEGRARASTGVLLRQSVPIARLFMSCLETVQMNRHYREAEAVLLHDPANEVF